MDEKRNCRAMSDQDFEVIGRKETKGEQVISSLQGGADNLEKALAELEEKLAPVTFPFVADNAGECETIEELPPLFSKVRDVEAKLNTMAHYIRQLTERVAV